MTVIKRVWGVVSFMLTIAVVFMLLSWYAGAGMDTTHQVKYVQGPMVCAEDEIATWVDAPHTAECVNVDEFIREETGR